MGASAFMMYQESEKTTARNSLIDSLQDEQRRRRLSPGEKAAVTDLPELWRARVKVAAETKGPWSFDGPMALRGVQVGDQVSIVAEKVGPDKSYHRARTTKHARSGESSKEAKARAVEEGWYPIRFLEKCDADGD